MNGSRRNALRKPSKMNTMLLSFAILALVLNATSCNPSSTPDGLDELGTVRMTIAGQVFELWIADEFAEHMQGLMYVSAERMAALLDGTERGMIFVFDHDQELSFWMKNTIIPLDIAYVDSDGTIVSTHTMAALDTRQGQYPSGGNARYAIEVNAGVWQRLGVSAGDTLDIPTSQLKGAP